MTYKTSTRRSNTDRSGRSFSAQAVEAVWQKGRSIPNYDPVYWRYDICGHPMFRADYGDRQSQHGWEVDHICPVSRGCGDELSNLQPLNWRVNAAKGDTYPWNCSML